MRKVLFIFIILIGCFLRFFHLSSNPPSLTWDEASWGYNAYSIGIDGRDEFGRFLPIDYLESFGDFKPPMYAYLDIIPIKFFGLNEFAIRFPSAFFGTFTVLISYFLTRAIFFTSKQKHWYGLITSFILAISPWHIMLSRAAFEANVATFFICLGVWLFLESIQRNNWLLIVSIISFIFSMYTFNTSRVVSPIIVILFVILFWKKLLQSKKQLIIACVIGIIIFTPLFRFLLTPQARLRFQEVNIFSDISVVQLSNQEIANDHGAWWSKLIHNRRWLFAQSYISHYFDNLTPSFLFIKGDGNPKFSTQDVGELYLWDLPFFVFGILLLFRKREDKWYVIPLWILVGIIPAATARETPHALRIETILPTLQVITAYGVANFLFIVRQRLLNINAKVIIILFFGVGLMLNLTYFLHGYFIHYPREFSGEWQYGYKDSINFVRDYSEDYKNIYVTEDLGRPYIYYVFYMKISPLLFRQTATVHRDVFGFVDVTDIGKYHFVKSMPKEKEGNSLFIDKPDNVPLGATKLKTFNEIDGKSTLVAYTL